MTVASTTNRVKYSTDGVSTSFSFPYFFLATSDLLVTTIDGLGNVTVQTLSTNYTVSGTQAANGTYPNGANVVFGIAPVSGETLVITRIPTGTQATHWVDGDPDPAGVKELAFDKLTLLVQRLLDITSRSVHFNDGYAATNFDPTLPAIITAQYLLAVNSAGTGWTLVPVGSAALSTFTGNSNGIITETDVNSAINEIQPYIENPYGVVQAAGIIPLSNFANQLLFIKGTGGPVDLTTTNPQIQAGQRIGQRLRLQGIDATNTVKIVNGNGLVLNGPYTMTNGSVIQLTWDGTNWTEDFRNDL